MSVEKIKKNDTYTIKAFLSYTDKNKHEAHALKERLGRYGIELFVSHDDLSTGQTWTDKIIDKIDERECFVQIISEDYHKANYTEQEAGMALALRRKIFPITLDKTYPVGFTYASHCEQLHPSNEGYFKIASSIVNELSLDSINWSIVQLDKSWSYEEANYIIDNILEQLNE